MRKKREELEEQVKSKEYQPSRKLSPSSNKKRNQNIFKVLYIFVGLFLLMAGRFVYFLVMESPEAINSSYNKRQDLLAERYVRGKILASDGTILAQTITESDGKEIRDYPFKQVFCHVVGSFDRGRTGVELSENFKLLKSHTNVVSQAITMMEGKKVIADDIVTTLDVNLQQAAYQALGNRKGAVVAIEPSTGRILAMVSTPSYDPNTVAQNWEYLVNDTSGNSTLLNRATQGLYAPGSTFKLVTALEYLKENPATYKEYSYTCKGSAMFGDRRISCFNNHVHGNIDLKESVAKSCNDSFAHIGTLLDLKKYRKTAEKLMFNKPLPLELPYKQSSFSLSNKDSENEIAQTAMGQGKTQISPMHSAMIVSSIANDGKMMKPYVVEGAQSTSGHISNRAKEKVLAEAMTEKEAVLLTSYMTEVVNSGTATALKNSKYQAAGKTGSAEYNSKGASHAWFVGFAPAKNPEIAISIIVESSGTGSEYAVPIAKKLFDSYLK